MGAVETPVLIPPFDQPSEAALVASAPNLREVCDCKPIQNGLISDPHQFNSASRSETSIMIVKPIANYHRFLALINR